MSEKRHKRRRKQGINNRLVLGIGLLTLWILAFSIAVFFLFFSGKDSTKGQTDEEVISREEDTAEEGREEKKEPEEKKEDMEEKEDPQSETNQISEETGAESEITKVLLSQNAQETDEVTIGIDVSRFQGTIDWKAVAEAGIEFAMIRVGYRTQAGGEIREDTNARYNMQEATANGIQIGAYFFSTALTKEEAEEEARWTAGYISQYAVTYPVAYNCEGFENPENRQYGLTVSQRTDCAEAFLKEIYNQGYTPMFYASKSELEHDAKWETSRLEGQFKIWVSQYPAAPYPDTAVSGYGGAHAMWQYTNNGTIAGISRPVDVNVAYFGYEASADALNPDTPETAGADAEALMNFQEVDETVTAKETVNLRDIPSQGEDSTVLRELANQETAQRTGISDSGWSRLIIDGERYYAVSNYLTTDLSYRPPVKEPDDGLKTKFQSVSEYVTPKIEINLRMLPSITNSDAVVAATVKAGEVFVRTGINTDYGWSRVEYNGQTLYCVSSYLTTAE
ncbi:MAG: glycoside hydrolase family 25 [Lachnospiraceae bacterium]|nr:glycoside hydrolase family 25 [Lachnospiraceae bacterium]MCI9622109.1 glycoside hydrolase family 25 [Lachnospiraceae bacterium]